MRAAPGRLGQHGDAQTDRSRSAPYAHVTASRQPFRAGYVASASADGGAGRQSCNPSMSQSSRRSDGKWRHRMIPTTLPR